MHMMHDPDEWMTVCTMTQHSASLSQVRRPKEDVLRIKAERRQREEEEILRKSDEIRARRQTA